MLDQPKIMDLQMGPETAIGGFMMAIRTRPEDRPVIPSPSMTLPEMIHKLTLELYATEDRLQDRLDEILIELRTPWYRKLWSWTQRQLNRVGDVTWRRIMSRSR